MIPHWTTLVIAILTATSVSASYYVMVQKRDFVIIRNEDGIPTIDEESVLNTTEDVEGVIITE